VAEPFNDDGLLSDEAREYLWTRPLVQFLSVIGIEISLAQALLIESYLRRHNKRVVDAVVVANESASRRTVLGNVSLN